MKNLRQRPTTADGGISSHKFYILTTRFWAFLSVVWTSVESARPCGEFEPSGLSSDMGIETASCLVCDPTPLRMPWETIPLICSADDCERMR